VLRIDGLSVSYGGLHALSGISLEVPDGAFIAIVGPNGAGKTTLFKAISGTVPIRAGRLEFDGVDLATVAPAKRAGLGIAHVPEGRQVFRGMSVLENLELGANSRAARLALPRTLEQAYGLFPRLAERRSQLAGTLSGGEQQMLAIGRGLTAQPKLLMLDEPSMGLSPAVADSIFECIERIHRESGVAVLLVEQRVAEALETCDYGYVLESSRLVLQGSHADLINDPRVRKAYLGM
jgi:branched-chain amino acid transport system ATP-binding protein